MDFVAGLPTTRKGHDYLFVVVDRFRKMCILMPCINTISGKEATNKFFEHVWVHFGIPRSIIADAGYHISQCILDYIVGEYGH
jgi:hypothetical protein